MGIQRENGYSATVSGYFATGGERYRLAKTNGATFVFSQPQSLPPDTEGELVVIVDDEVNSRRVILPDGATPDETTVAYKVVAPF